MRQSIKITVLVALGITTTALSIALVELKPANAQESLQQAEWVASDAPQAVRALLGTQSYSYLDRVFVPGTHRNDALSSDSFLKVKAHKNKAPKIINKNDGGFAYRSFRPAPDSYVVKNGYPKLRTAPKGRTNLLDGAGGTKFKSPTGELKTQVTKSGAFTTKRDDAKANKFALTLKASDKIGKMPKTRAQLKAFKTRVKAVKRSGGGTVTKTVAGSRNDQPATFVPLIRVQDGEFQDFRVSVR